MEITFLLPYAGLGGGVRVVACLGEHLRRRGHEVFVVSLPLRQPGLRARFRALLRGRFIRRWREHRPEEGFFENVGFTHHVIDRYRPIVDHDVPDADWVVATWYETANWAAALSPGKGRKAIFLQQYEANIFPDQAAAVDAVWRMPIYKIACSQWLSDLGRERFGTGPIPVVPNGIDAAMFDAPPRRRGRPPTVGLMYSRSFAKGLPVATAVISQLQDEIPDLRIMAYGAERPNPARLPPNCDFFFRPVQAQLKELYARCDVWLCCSHSEGFHLPPHEAMACRVPVVSTRVGGPMDMIEDGVDGILVRPGDVDGLVAGVLRLLRCDEAEWAAMGELAYKKARRYSWEKSARLFEQALLDAPAEA
jgi:glycosyltransferase involved in cell wall biosynthesis